ncbi:shikimate dehydrogenase [Bailinhaonella thermotolerans]|uniref:Shikimate dehydrogenase n=1 Tax=Bailinhaonella thermotolerans TaxID=1070861 RepID=A0A3A4AZF0_9ACTN|nr:shikimate dehydrogenase [Bailinhaonella thermotolerans]RJL33959.1 shikimate dehydrogenase [Bailinhaonella thermotolerans]
MTVTRRAAVLGSPIAHSLSPVLHRAAYAGMGLDGWSYEAIECDEERLPALLDSLDGSWAGLSLTMPLKRAVLPLLDSVSDLAVQVGGANTVIFEGGRRRGENTDVHGIVRALEEAGVTAPSSAVVLGGGATACSALAALREMGLSRAVVAVRDLARAGEARAAADRLGVRIEVRTLDETAFDADLVVSTVPAGAADAHAVPVAAAAKAVFDVVYAPWPTPLAMAVAERGGVVVGGFPMLLHQAVRQVELMTGRADVPVEAMRRAGQARLAAT